MDAREDDLTFNRRLNQDGTFDSICMECFQTIAGGLEEPALEQFEKEHVCVAEDRDRFDQWRTVYGVQRVSGTKLKQTA